MLQSWQKLSVSRMVAGWKHRLIVSQAVKVQEDLGAQNVAAMERESVLQQQQIESFGLVQQLQAQIADLQQELAKQGAKLSEASLVESEKQEAKSELRSVAASGAELVGDVTSQLSQILMALQSQGTVFNTQLNSSLGVAPNGL